MWLGITLEAIRPLLGAKTASPIALSRKTPPIGAILGKPSWRDAARFRSARAVSPSGRDALESDMDFLLAALIGASFVVAASSILDATTTVVANRSHDAHDTTAGRRQKQMRYR